MIANTMLDMGALALLYGDPLGLREIEESLAWQQNGPLPYWLDDADLEDDETLPSETPSTDGRQVDGVSAPRDRISKEPIADEQRRVVGVSPPREVASKETPSTPTPVSFTPASLTLFKPTPVFTPFPIGSLRTQSGPLSVPLGAIFDVFDPPPPCKAAPLHPSSPAEVKSALVAEPPPQIIIAPACPAPAQAPSLLNPCPPRPEAHSAPAPPPTTPAQDILSTDSIVALIDDSAAPVTEVARKTPSAAGAAVDPVVAPAARRFMPFVDLASARFCLLTSAAGQLWALPLERIVKVAGTGQGKTVDLYERLEAKKRRQAGVAIIFDNDAALVVDAVLGPRSLSWKPLSGDRDVPNWRIANATIAGESVGLLDWELLLS
jgi:hypothetical protein